MGLLRQPVAASHGHRSASLQPHVTTITAQCRRRGTRSGGDWWPVPSRRLARHLSCQVKAYPSTRWWEAEVSCLPVTMTRSLGRAGRGAGLCSRHDSGSGVYLGLASPSEVAHLTPGRDRSCQRGPWFLSPCAFLGPAWASSQHGRRVPRQAFSRPRGSHVASADVPGKACGVTPGSHSSAAGW